MENFPEQNKLNRLQWSSFNVTNPLMQWTLEEFPAACTFHPSKKFSTQARRPLRWNSFSWQVEWTLHCTQLHSLVSSLAQWVHDRGIVAWLPDVQIFRFYAFGPSGLKNCGSAMLRCKIWNPPFLGLRPLPHALQPGAIQGKEGIIFCHLATLKRAKERTNGQGAKRRQIEANLHNCTHWWLLQCMYGI